MPAATTRMLVRSIAGDLPGASGRHSYSPSVVQAGERLHAGGRRHSPEPDLAEVREPADRVIRARHEDERGVRLPELRQRDGGDRVAEPDRARPALRDLRAWLARPAPPARRRDAGV